MYLNDKTSKYYNFIFRTSNINKTQIDNSMSQFKKEDK